MTRSQLDEKENEDGGGHIVTTTTTPAVISGSKVGFPKPLLTDGQKKNYDQTLTKMDPFKASF